MGIARGPNIIRDGLVFGYDTGYGVADNNTSTRFYPGEPTVNSLASTAFGYSGITLGSDAGGTYLQTNSATTGYNYIKVPNITVSSNETYTWSFELKSLETITQSGNKYYFDTNEHSNEFSTSNDNSRVSSSQVRPSSLPANEWVKFALTVTMKPDLTGAYSYDFLNFIKPHFTSKKIYYRNMQFEHNKSHHTPFVAGTRSSTQSLIDVKRTRDVDLSYMSFDSTGQPDMDGSSDYVDLGSDVEISSVANAASNGWTAEYVFNSDSASTLQHFNGCEESVHNAGWLALLSSKLAVWNRDPGVWKYGSTTFASDTWYHIAFVQVNGTTMQFYVNGVAEGGDHASYSWNSAKSAFFARYVGKYAHPANNYSRYFNGHIPVARLYSKALTASEITKNYKALKNRFNI